MLPFLYAASLMAGCGQLEDVKETIEGLTDPLVLEAFLIGAAEPDTDLIDLEETAFADGASLRAFLADATSLDDLEDSALDGASVAIKSASLGTLDMVAEAGGLYTATGQDGLEYYPSEEYVLSATYEEEVHHVAVTAPQPVDIALAEEHTVGDKLLIDLTDYDYDAVLVAVIDAMSGDITYSNEPDGIEEMYEFTHQTDNVKRHEIPGAAFSQQSVYTVDIAGMRNAGTDDYTDMNTGLSSFMVGQMRFYAVTAM